MKRRSVLTAIGVGSVSLAGCLGDANPGDDRHSCLDDGHVSFAAESDEFAVVTDDDTVETLLFTLENATDCSLTVAPRTWHIERDADDGWREVARDDGGDDRRELSSGEQHQWSLSLTPHPTPWAEDKTFIVAELTEGTYALVVTGQLDGTEEITRRAQFSLTKRPANATTTD